MILSSHDSVVFSRRQFIGRIAALGAGTVALLGADPDPAIAANPKQSPPWTADNIIDTNVSLFHWPFRRLPLDSTSKLVTKFQSAGMVQAWAGSFEALLHKNLSDANEALARECQQHGREILLPFGTVNPRLPDWQEDLRRCHEKYKMAGIRLFPNYHGYNLDDPDFAKLLAAVESCGLIVQLALSMEDERVQHPLVRVANADAAPLPALLEKFPKLKLVLLNWFRPVKTDLLAKLGKTKQVYFDISMVEGVGGLSNLLRDVPAEQIVFGSSAPFFYLESVLLKLKESVLPLGVPTLIMRENARQLLR